MRITLLYFEGCPHWQTVDARLQALVDECGRKVDRWMVDTREEAERLGFRGSPTILVDGRDPFASGDEPVGLSCRVYDTPDGPAGAPTVAQLRDVLRATRTPGAPRRRPRRARSRRGVGTRAVVGRKDGVVTLIRSGSSRAAVTSI